VHPVASRVASTVNAGFDGKSATLVSDLRAGNPRLMSTSPTATPSVPFPSQPTGRIARQELEAECAAGVFDNPHQLVEGIPTTPIAALTATAG
jgi:hypothetical protein